jgi:alkylated DNA repair dioxygenase AlkB
MYGITGLLYIPQYVSQEHHDYLVATIAQQPWRGDLKRRTQHYGYVYDYRAKTVDPSSYLGPLPRWLERIATQLRRDGLIPVEPDQAIVNEYEPGQGIADHVDCTPCFGDVVISLSLGASVIMDLKQKEEGRHVPLWLEPRSLLVLRDEARYSWTHGIPGRQQDVWQGQTIPRGRRVSVTFRKVIVEGA